MVEPRICDFSEDAKISSVQSRIFSTCYWQLSNFTKAAFFKAKGLLLVQEVTLFTSLLTIFGNFCNYLWEHI